MLHWLKGVARVYGPVRAIGLPAGLAVAITALVLEVTGTLKDWVALPVLFAAVGFAAGCLFSAHRYRPIRLDEYEQLTASGAVHLTTPTAAAAIHHDGALRVDHGRLIAAIPTARGPRRAVCVFPGQPTAHAAGFNLRAGATATIRIDPARLPAREHLYRRRSDGAIASTRDLPVLPEN